MKELKAIKPIITKPYQPICSIKTLINEPSSQGQVVSTHCWLKLNHCKDIFLAQMISNHTSIVLEKHNQPFAVYRSVVVYEDDLAYKIMQLHHGLRLNKVLSADRDKILLTKYKFVTNTNF
jgi:hypothetical protein